MSKLVGALCELFHIKHYCTSSYHPQTNATVERANSTLAKALRAYIDENQLNWPALLPSVMMAFRSTPASATTGFSPYQLVFGKEMLLPVDTDLLPKPSLPTKTQDFFNELIDRLKTVKKIAKDNQELVNEKTKQRFDQKAKVPDFQVNDRVLLKNEATKQGLSHKLSPKWQGPYIITKLGPNCTYGIKHCQTNKVHTSLVNAKRIKHYQENIGPEMVDQENEEFEAVDNIQNNVRAETQGIANAPQQPQKALSHGNPQQSNNTGQKSENAENLHDNVHAEKQGTANAPQLPQKTLSKENPQNKNDKGQVSENCVPRDKQHTDDTLVTAKNKQNDLSADLIWPKRVLKVRMYKGERVLCCYLEGQKMSVWLTEREIDPNFLCQYWESHTKSGSKRKRIKKSRRFFNK